jgi:RNA polymerase sigma-70 factor (ECF subfamily)
MDEFSMPEAKRQPDAPLARAGGAPGGGALPAALAAAAAKGDLVAAQRLVEQVAPAMHGAVRSVMGPEHPDTDDVVQQALIAFVQSLPRFRGESQPSTYAMSIAIRAALGARKRTLHDGCRLEALAHRSGGDQPEPALPIDGMQAESRRALVRRLLDELPTEQAETLTLHVVLDLPLKEVAQAEGVSVNTIKSRLRLAKRALRERILTDHPLADELEVGP